MSTLTAFRAHQRRHGLGRWKQGGIDLNQCGNAGEKVACYLTEGTHERRRQTIWIEVIVFAARARDHLELWIRVYAEPWPRQRRCWCSMQTPAPVVHSGAHHTAICHGPVAKSDTVMSHNYRTIISPACSKPWPVIKPLLEHLNWPSTIVTVIGHNQWVGDNVPEPRYTKCCVVLWSSSKTFYLFFTPDYKTYYLFFTPDYKTYYLFFTPDY